VQHATAISSSRDQHPAEEVSTNNQNAIAGGGVFVPWHDDEYYKFQFVISGNQVQQSFPREALLNSSVVTIQLISSSTCFVLLASAAPIKIEYQERQDKKEAEGCLKNCLF
jgi:hypothetical protein